MFPVQTEGGHTSTLSCMQCGRVFLCPCSCVCKRMWCAPAWLARTVDSWYRGIIGRRGLFGTHSQTSVDIAASCLRTSAEEEGKRFASREVPACAAILVWVIPVSRGGREGEWSLGIRTSREGGAHSQLRHPMLPNSYTAAGHRCGAETLPHLSSQPPEARPVRTIVEREIWWGSMFFGSWNAAQPRSGNNKSAFV